MIRILDPIHTCILGGALLAAVCIPLQGANAYTETVLYAFSGGSDGANPGSGLIFDSSGNLYSTTGSGGAACLQYSSGCGTVFELAPNGTETVLHTFTGNDGAIPAAGVILDSRGNLYGTTLYGGNVGGGGGECTDGCGTAFELASGGALTVLYAFCSQVNNVGTCIDGEDPYAGLIADQSGNLYGTTLRGGTAPGDGQGVVFELAAGGGESVLYSFGSVLDDGNEPFAGLIADSAGNFYGTTEQGGDWGAGTVFKLSPGGTEAMPYSFYPYSQKNGTGPNGVIMDGGGNLYGTIRLGGKYNFGAVFRLDVNRKLRLLHSFAAGDDGAYPNAGLAMDANGNLYGTATDGGGGSACPETDGCGIVFRISASGKEDVLRAFAGGSGGAYPSGSLILDGQSNVYGTTANGGGVGCGGSGCGTVFKLTNAKRRH
jgi:uncharacterized repeat protein (TIGR03803 family)